MFSLRLASSPDRIHVTHVAYADKGSSAFTQALCAAARLNLHSPTTTKVCLHLELWTPSSLPAGGEPLWQHKAHPPRPWRLHMPAVFGTAKSYFIHKTIILRKAI